jgi:hypothetical protein
MGEIGGMEGASGDISTTVSSMVIVMVDVIIA